MPTHVYFLPGMMCDERLFSAQVQALDGFCCCTVVPFHDGDSIEAYARAVLHTIRLNHGSADSPGKTLLIGLSMGGIIAMQCMRQAPLLIDAVVLMDTNPLAELPTRRAMRLPQIKRVLDGELESVLIEEMKPLYLAPANQSDNDILALVLNMAQKLGADVFARQSNAIMNRSDQTSVLSQWTKPAMILYGAHDHLCPPERHVMMHELMPHSSLVVVPDAGHLPTLESPQRVNDALRAFIETL